MKMRDERMVRKEGERKRGMDGTGWDGMGWMQKVKKELGWYETVRYGASATEYGGLHRSEAFQDWFWLFWLVSKTSWQYVDHL